MCCIDFNNLPIMLFLECMTRMFHIVKVSEVNCYTGIIGGQTRHYHRWTAEREGDALNP